MASNDYNQAPKPIKKFPVQYIVGLVLVALVGIGAFMFFGNSQSSPQTASTAQTTAENRPEGNEPSQAEPIAEENTNPSSQDIVRIGLNLELSGVLGDYGTEEREGALTAIRLFNEKSDRPFTVEAVELDAKSDAQSAAENVQDLVNQGVVGIIGPASSGASISAYEIADQYGVPVISPSNYADGGVLNSYGDAYKYGWTVSVEDQYEGRVMADYAHWDLGAARAAVFYEEGDYGYSVRDGFTSQFEAQGGQIVRSFGYSSGQTDFSPEISQLLGENINVIMICGYYDEALEIIKQAREAGLDVPVLGGDGFSSSVLTDGLGDRYSYEVYYLDLFSIEDSPDILTFTSAFEKDWGSTPSLFAALSYDATNLLIDSLVQSEQSGQEPNEVIKGTSFDGITGSLSFDANTHAARKSMTVIEITGAGQTQSHRVSAL